MIRVYMAEALFEATIQRRARALAYFAQQPIRSKRIRVECKCCLKTYHHFGLLNSIFILVKKYGSKLGLK